MTNALDRVLVAEVVRALHRVEDVRLDRVPKLGIEHSRRPALGAHGVRAHRLELRDDADADLLADPRRLDGGPESGYARADDKEVLTEPLCHLGAPPQTFPLKLDETGCSSLQALLSLLEYSEDGVIGERYRVAGDPLTSLKISVR